MLKKIILLFTLSLITFCSMQTFAATLRVEPISPEDWGYQAATVQLNDRPNIPVGQGVTIGASDQDAISLAVYAMNAKPKLDKSCQHLRIDGEGSHLLRFSMIGWAIVCQFV